MVETGANVELEGILDGHPPPDIKWYKNGVEIPAEDLPDRVEITFGGQKARLSVRDVQESDAGRYTCTARNAAGIASNTADVVVRRTQFPYKFAYPGKIFERFLCPSLLVHRPVFGRRLQAQTVRPGSRVTMEVEITGTPTPEVTWMKDDRPLPDYIAVSAEGGHRHRIVLAKVTELDAGRYTVCARNRAGEAISTAELFVCPAAAVTVSAVSPTPDLKETEARKYSPVETVQHQVDGKAVEEKPVEAVKAESPPETVASSPKAESPVKSGRKKIDVAAKARMLEEASKIISPTEVPGGIRLLPLPTPEASATSHHQQQSTNKFFPPQPPPAPV